jgi:hypothetical protein
MYFLQNLVKTRTMNYSILSLPIRALQSTRLGLAVWLTAALVWTGAALQAQAPSVSYSIDPAEVEVVPGEEFTVDVVVTPQNNPSISSQSVYLTYDGSVIQLQDVEQVAKMEQQFNVFFNTEDNWSVAPENDPENDSGFAYAVGFLPNGVTENLKSTPYVLVRLTFLAVGADETTSSIKFFDDGGVRENLAIATGGNINNILDGARDGSVLVDDMIEPPVNPGEVAMDIGPDLLDICGTEVMLGNTNFVPQDLDNMNNMRYSGGWSLVDDDGGTGMLDDPSLANPILMGVFGGTYTLEWTITHLPTGTPYTSQITVSFAPDADLPGGLGDGVQDCVDVCLGFDDNINSDNANLPDGCDCNPTNDQTELILVSVVPASNFVEADWAIESDAVIDPAINPDPVVFKAANNIKLNPGFHAKAGVTFSAIIDDCREENLQAASTDLLADAGIDVPATNGLVIDKMSMKLIPTVATNSTMVRLSIPDEQDIHVQLYNQNGQLIKTLMDNQRMEAGRYDYQLDLATIEPGMYYVKLIGAEVNTSQRLIVVRR